MTTSPREPAAAGNGPAANPFRASQTRPGSLPFLFADEDRVEGLLQRFLDQDRRGQIVGPHGSGKSTLMLHLVDAMRSHQIDVCHLRMDSERGWTRSHAREVRRAVPRTVVAIDGFDQLAWQSRMWLRALVAWRPLGLLVTTHRVHVGLPVLRTTSMNEHLARRVILEYLERSTPKLAGEQVGCLLAKLPARLQAHQGNLREVLFDLYEDCQVRRGTPGQGDAAPAREPPAQPGILPSD